jgi:hypothetical protein
MPMITSLDTHALAQHDAQPLHAKRLGAAKRAYTTRRVPAGALLQLDTDPAQPPRPGDLVLARVVRTGKHQHLELPGGRRSALFAGDEIVVACAARYAPDQFEAALPTALGACHLAAGGGVAAQVVSRCAGVAPPTEIELVGLVLDGLHRRVNLAQHGLHKAFSLGPRPVTIASLGTSMNAGKTTAAAHLVRGLVRAGLRVGAAKITGTGSGNDPGLLRDAGAERVLDFVDCGYASTAGLELPALQTILDTVQTDMAHARMDALVIEVADGLLQRETAMLLQSTHFARRVDATLFASGEAMGAIAGVRWLHDRGLQVLGLTGTLTRSPLARAEAEAATGLRSFGLDELGDAAHAQALHHAALSAGAAGLAA